MLTLFGLFGTQMDSPAGAKRWSRWRPSMTLARRDDLLVDRFVLLGGTSPRARTLISDWRRLSPETEVVPVDFEPEDPWDLEGVYAALLRAADALDHDPDGGELWVHITTGTHVMQICLFLLVEAGFLPGKLVQTSPPRRGQPDGGYALIDLDLARYDTIAARFAAQEQEGTAFLKAGIETRNAPFNKLIGEIEQVAVGSRAPILLTGPTGAGKSRLARRIYALKKHRRQLAGPMVHVNCATLRGDQAMSALFGHRRGSFTGAVADHPGLLARADGGLLFLDEIGELGADEQAMLLRAVEERTFLPVGGTEEVHSDFQLIAGTNRDLRQSVREGAFREDLLARIDLWHFTLPSLSQRREDIAPNIAFEEERLSRELDRRIRLNAEARQRFLRFAESSEASWEANFRDLQAAMTRMATLAPQGRIGTSTVDGEIARLRGRWAGGQRQHCPRITALLGVEALAELDRFERVQLEDVLEVCAGSESLSAAGRHLFAASRLRKKSKNDADRLRKYLARFGLDWEAVRG